MYNSYYSLMKRIYYAFISILICACTSVIEDSEYVEAQESEMRVLTRSEALINYPMALYTFNVSTGSMVSCTIVEDDTDEAILRVPKGNYRIVALGGIPSVDGSPTLDDLIELPSSMQSPFQMGSATVYVAQNTTVSIMLYNQVSAIDMTLYNIPENATDASVSLSFVYEDISYSGTMSGNGIVDIPLEKAGDGVWASERFYILPTSTNQLTISISITTPDETHVYSYTHESPLLPNTPYVFSGSLYSGFSINGDICVAGWNDTEEIAFTFGGDIADGSDDDSADTIETFIVSEIPNSGELWNNHFVAATEDVTDSTAVLLLLSTTEWTGVTGAYHVDTPHMATTIVSDYCEEDLSGWSIPKRDDVKLMRAAVGNDNLTLTNSLLEANSIPALQVGDDAKGNAIRYLCDDGTYSYVWDGSTISKSGTKRMYHLRAVKRVGVKL